MNFNKTKLQKHPGQTLIETVVAIFILVTGVTAALSLALYAFDSSSNINKQIIGTGLAREGIEAVKNMRDTNWLKDTPVHSCYDYASPSLNDATCYQNWLTKEFQIGTPGTYRLGFDPDPSDPGKAWLLTAAGSGQFGLNFSDFTGSGFAGFYSPSGSPSPDPSGTYYYRKITITADSSDPYNPAIVGALGPQLLIASQVWWTDKYCPPEPNWPGPGKCSIELDTDLTNWKDY